MQSDVSERSRARVKQSVSAQNEKVFSDEKDDSVIGTFVNGVDVIDLNKKKIRDNFYWATRADAKSVIVNFIQKKLSKKVILK